MVNWLKDLFSANNTRVSTQFALSIFCTIMGFLAAVSVYVYYAFWLHLDLTPNLTLITQVFIGQSLGGTIASILYKPKGESHGQPGEPQASGTGPGAVNPE